MRNMDMCSGAQKVSIFKLGCRFKLGWPRSGASAPEALREPLSTGSHQKKVQKVAKLRSKKPASRSRFPASELRYFLYFFSRLFLGGCFLVV